MLFGRPPDCKGMEVYNDFNGNLTNLFYCVKNRTLAFLKELGFLPLNSRHEFNVLRRFFEKGEFDNEYLGKELDLAQQNLPPPEFEEIKAILMEQAEPSDVRRAAIWQASRRLADTVVENKDFEALIRQYDRDDAFFYCDPPYYMTEGHYAVEFLKTDHQRLRDTLARCKGKWMVSYNDCDFIRGLYQEYTITPVTRLSNLAQRYEGGCEYPEVIITNYDPKERENSSCQLNLFDYGISMDEDNSSEYRIDQEN